MLLVAASLAALPAGASHAETALPDPLTDADFLPVDPAKAKIGQLLFYDKILSGNRNISCGTCHHHDHAGTDGLSLGIGEGGIGVGPERTAGTGDSRIPKRIPRNAPALWNLGHRSVTTLFHDGRLEVSDLYGNGFNSPAQEWLPQGLPDIVAAQALFPLTAQFEMAGNPRENKIAGAIHDRIDLAWPILAKRVRSLPAYGDAFVAAFVGVEHPSDVGIVEIATAMSHFIRAEWRNHDSPFDRYLQGNHAALSSEAIAGMRLFYGEAGCASCHAGALLTDHRFRALGLPQFGPGRTRQWDPIVRDVGRMAESNRLEDAYRFRTPSLRNVALTGPYGHNGAYPTLERMIRHHLNPPNARTAWTPADAALPSVPWVSAIDFVVQQDRRESERHARARDIMLPARTDVEIDALVAFLNALTGDSAETRPLGRPAHVPSGLPVD
ncbi:MAG: cytochrome c peroxidase [Pseudomonadota bacterium]